MFNELPDDHDHFKEDPDDIAQRAGEALERSRQASHEQLPVIREELLTLRAQLATSLEGNSKDDDRYDLLFAQMTDVINPPKPISARGFGKCQKPKFGAD